MKNEKMKIGTISFSSINLLEIAAVIEFEEGKFGKDVVFFSLYPEFERNLGITMQLRLNDLCNLSEGLNELIVSKTTKYEKFTKSNATVSKLYLECKKGAYWVNLFRQEKVVSMSFDSYSIRTLIKRIERLCIMLERALYESQEEL
jgi:hypothetical protein